MALLSGVYSISLGEPYFRCLARIRKRARQSESVCTRLNKLKTISLALFLIGAVSGGVWAHRPSGGSRQATQGDVMATESTGELAAAPVADARPTSQPSAQCRNDSDSGANRRQPDTDNPSSRTNGAAPIGGLTTGLRA
jgi:hypothetical protein